MQTKRRHSIFLELHSLNLSMFIFEPKIELLVIIIKYNLCVIFIYNFFCLFSWRVAIILEGIVCFIGHCILYISALCRIQIPYHVPMAPTVGNQDCGTLQTAPCVRWECTASLSNPRNIQLLNQWVFFLLFIFLVTRFTIKEAVLIFWSLFTCDYYATLTSLLFSPN